MKYLVSLYAFGLLFGCGSNPKENPPKEIIKNTTPIEEVIIEPVIKEPILPPGAVEANFIEGEVPLYAHVKYVDKKNGKTIIAFQDKKLPPITISETYGASLSSLRFDEFDRDLLLITTKLKDPIFNKYFLYIYKDGQWKKVVNGFSLHKSHVTDSLIPIRIDPENPNNLFRYYSVFDLDETSELGYTWRLLSESIPIQNK
ncbi:hypothetical protein ACFQO1_09575 [Jejudonia soesokkakensis]|uniref:Lipoprotein n=1 Tax=Jejudonia soesokkakensis TaxID=1323432 RepID=A0ABW2MYY2_9FLAO